MADFSFPQLPAVTPPPQTSLADMMSIARGAQAYQQAEQINPLDLQAKQLVVQQAQAINPLALRQQTAATSAAEGTLAPTIARAGSEAQTAATGADAAALTLAAKKAQTISNGYVGAINDPIVLEAASNPNAVDKTKLVDFVKNFGKTQAKAVGIPEDQSDKVMQPYLDIAQNNPAALRSYFIQRHVAGLDQAAQLGTYQTTTTVTPEGRTVKTTPGLGTQNVELGFAGGLQGNAVGGAAPVSAGTEVAPGMRVPYPVRSAAQPFIAEPTEAKDQAAGAEYRNNLVTGQMGLSQAKRNVQEVMDTANKIGSDLYFAKGGIPGQIEQKIRMAIGSEQYDMLAKDLANMAITNSKAMGNVGGTVAGLDMAAVANGTIKVPPDVLTKIARRVQADQTNLDMQANGAQQFAQKFGDNNMKAYQQAWNANADSKIFEAMNITRDVTDPARLKTELNRLFPNPNDYQDFLKKYRNIKKLSETGSL
ncbi:hypothetical protein UFOVP632_15 [uncultured Caudovirales phage]|uniref:Uncharacterized protein n=1 Tax=uncultured Caudovirales phage TaxID=2100421 RepID=A0A6J7XIB0_9CAUD|nr:hypothetical protein UFOVP632_15 [uncultured Caudovirales phage]CAB4184586.1 hypothetical protein UFOVP1117_18 [uncultured Caudovirales phage]CAB5229849.1 hypothetical protein UFOVP1570_19 [uncultured Caudovirales phage]